jgi:hypothetical protein
MKKLTEYNVHVNIGCMRRSLPTKDESRLVKTSFKSRSKGSVLHGRVGSTTDCGASNPSSNPGPAVFVLELMKVCTVGAFETILVFILKAYEGERM